MKQLLLAFALASATLAHGQSAPSEQAWVNAEVVRVNVERGRVTLKHERIATRTVQMDAMTMAFRVSQPSMLADLKPGDKVQFAFSEEGHEVVVTELRRAP
jgi:Cu(I)/Ag(I) efflux system protein CusF